MKTRFTLAIFLLPVCCLAVDAQQLLRIRATPPASAGGSSISQLQPNTLEDPGTPPASAGGSSISQLQPNTLEDPGTPPASAGGVSETCYWLV